MPGTVATRLVKNALLCLIAVSSAASAGFARDSAAPPRTEPPRTSFEPSAYVPPRPLLWKVSDADNAVYLVGSFHLLKHSDYPLSPDIVAAFEGADRIVFEVAPEDLDDPDTSHKFLDAARFDDGRSLVDVLPPRLREKLHRLLARQGSSIQQVDHYSPWYVNLSLMLGLSQSLGFDAGQGLDRYLMQQAAQAGKPSSGLESIEDQLYALAASPMDEQIRGLEDFLDRPQEIPGQLSDLHQAWRDGDVDRLDELTRVEMLDKTPRTYQVINVERNEAWLPQLRRMLDAYHRQEDFMVVVGALHLLGEDGVVEKLRAQGYRIERICSACDAESDDADGHDAGGEIGGEQPYIDGQTQSRQPGGPSPRA